MMKIESIRRVVRLAGLVLPLTWLAGLLAAQIQAAATAESFAVAVRTATVNQKTASAVMPADGGMVQDQASEVSIANLVTAQDAFAIASGGGSDGQYSDAMSSATLGSVRILEGLITADGVVALASSTVGNSDAAGSSLANLVVNGVGMDDPAPNTRVNLPGVGYVVLNEQIQSSDGGITVNMIHVVLQQPIVGVLGAVVGMETTGEIIVGSASAKVN